MCFSCRFIVSLLPCLFTFRLPILDSSSIFLSKHKLLDKNLTFCHIEVMNCICCIILSLKQLKRIPRWFYSKSIFFVGSSWYLILSMFWFRLERADSILGRFSSIITEGTSPNTLLSSTHVSSDARLFKEASSVIDRRDHAEASLERTTKGINLINSSSAWIVGDHFRADKGVWNLYLNTTDRSFICFED